MSRTSVNEERGAPQRDREYCCLLPTHIPPIESLWFDVPLRPAPGKAVLIMLPHETMNPQTEIEYQGRKIKLELPDSYLDKNFASPRVRNSSQQPDVGIVARFTPEISTRTGTPITAMQQQIRIGMVVGVRPYSGAHFEHADFPWIPEKRKIVITKYGVDDDLLFEIEFSQEDAA